MKKQKTTITKKLIRGGATLLLVLAVCLCLFAFMQTVNNGYVSFFGYSLFKVTTGSMEPTVAVGDLILTKNEPIEDVALDDIVSFFSKEAYLAGRVVTHRVVAVERGASGGVTLTTRGDANAAADIHRVEKDNYIGRVVWISGEGNVLRTAVGFLSSGTGFFTCIAIPAILISALIFRRGVAVMLADIKRLKEEIKQGEKGENTPSPEEYEAMRERIREELIEELKNGDDGEENTTE